MGVCLGGEKKVKRDPGTTPNQPTIKQFKFLLIGNPDVGKSSLLYRFSTNKYASDKLDLGQETRLNGEVVFERDGKKTICQIEVWDTAGQEKFRTITSSFYDRTDAILVVYDITEPSSFDDLNSWFQEAGRYARDACLLMVGNKSDRDSERKIDSDKAKEVAEKHGAPYIETSALNGSNVIEAFRILAKQVIKDKDPDASEGNSGEEEPTTKYNKKKSDVDDDDDD